MDGEAAGLPAVDAPALMARLDGDRELLAELHEIFAGEAEGLLDAIGEGVSGQDAAAVQRAAHTLKGAVANFCAPAAMATALALETAGRNGDLANAPALLDRLRAEIDAVRAALARLAPRDSDA